ncbi:electron transfer protein 1 [Auriscalpium vulgare]|uniref:Electron transfer protein 1 n=1 Tax=Auriscalpium vulgare TaxID=40419 RepID=A0ACB8S8U4_9AGAM|nr:electron transfer protein 1 [Auriscalpium vulgare]
MFAPFLGLRRLVSSALPLVKRTGQFHHTRNLFLSSRISTPPQPPSIRARVRGNAFLPRLKPSHKPIDSRFFSSNGTLPAKALPVLSAPPVAGWLLMSSTLVFAVIVVGGVTRLTESGLSITEWKPVSGVIPPLTHAEWEEEFTKYRATPEFKLLNHNISLSEFKSIFYMEWGHRVLGRVIGVAFVLPLAYFALRRRLSPSLPLQLSAFAVLLGLQGVLGWYMVKSGLSESFMEQPHAVPRVSQYRLAAHLSAALVLYAGMFASGISVLMDWRYAHAGKWSGLVEGGKWEQVLSNPIVRKFRTRSVLLTGLVLLTAVSGAFVAGLDAGLVYNEFPLMGGRIAPPTDELISTHYATGPGNAGLWRNIFENPTTVQFDHRVLAITTYLSATALWATTRSAAVRAALPPLTTRLATAMFGMANLQVLLGISTLLYLVPVPLAAAHQAGSVALLTTVIHLLLSLRRPSQAARLWRQASAAKAAKTT